MIKHFIIFFQADEKELPLLKSTILFLRDKTEKPCAITVIDIEESTFDFLYNSVIERANSISKRGP